MPASKPPGRPVRSRVAALSHRLEDLLVAAQRKEKAPPGMVKCPACGAPVLPTKNGRIRVHANPVGGARCDAGGKPWADFGKVPKPIATRTTPPARAPSRKPVRRGSGAAAGGGKRQQGKRAK